MLAKLNLRTRILLGYIIPATVYLGFAILVYATGNKAFNTFQEVERVEKVIVKVNNLKFNFQSLVLNARGYLVDKNPEFSQEYQKSLLNFRQEANNTRELIRKPDQKQRLEQIIQLSEEFNSFSSNFFRLVDSNKQAEAVALFKTGKGREIIRKFDQISQEFNENERMLLSEQTIETESALWWLGGVVLGSIILIGITVILALSTSSSIVQTISKVVQAIAASTSQIITTVEEQERVASQQAASVNQTTTTMAELEASSKTTAEQAATAVNGAQQALALAAEGTSSVQQTLGGMTALQEKVADIASAIAMLSQQTNQIGSITNVVANLANQTNMLALNAAVEALRAGENGKGFGVVAAEIRRLADQSKKSAEKIDNLVGDIQSALNSTVIVTKEGTDTVKEGVKIAQETSDAFRGVVEAINQIFTNNQQMALNAKQQAIAIQQVVDAMNAINIGAQQTASGINQTKIGTQELNEAAKNLKALGVG